MNDTFEKLDHFQLPPHPPEHHQKKPAAKEAKSKMSNSAVPRERRPSTGAPISDLKGPIGPGFTRPKHKRTFTGFGAGEIKSVEGMSLRYASVSLQASPHPIRMGLNSNGYRAMQLRSPNPSVQHGRSSRSRASRQRMTLRRRSFAMSRPRSLDRCSIATRRRLTLRLVWPSEID